MGKKVIIIIAVGIILMAVLFIVSLLELSVSEQRPFTGHVPLSQSQVQSLLNDEPYWTLPDKSERVVARRLVESVGHSFRYSLENDLSSKKGNCEGQAVVCCAVINSAFEQRGFDGCHAEPVLCTVWWCGLNANKLLCSVTPAKYKHYVVNHCVTKVNYSDGGVEYYDSSLFNGSLSPLGKHR